MLENEKTNGIKERKKRARDKTKERKGQTKERTKVRKTCETKLTYNRRVVSV